MAIGRRGLSSCRYQDFVHENIVFNDSTAPNEHSRHAIQISKQTPSGSIVGLQSSVISPFFKKSGKRGVASTLWFESQWNSMISSSLRINSERHVELQAHLQASPTLRFTLEAHESATEKMPASFARIGCDYKDSNMFTGVKIDAVNGPTLYATCGGHYGHFAFGILGAYDVGLDHSDRLGRITSLECATSYHHQDVHAQLQVKDKGKKIKFRVAQDITRDLLVGSEVCFDRRKDQTSLCLRSNYTLDSRDQLAASLGSDGVFIGAYEWQTTPQLKTRVSAQVDIRNFDPYSHHLGVSIEIS